MATQDTLSKPKSSAMLAVLSLQSLKPRNGQYIKELLSTLTIDERCGVMLEFEDACQDLFAQLVADSYGCSGWVEKVDLL